MLAVQYTEDIQYLILDQNQDDVEQWDYQLYISSEGLKQLIDHSMASLEGLLELCKY
jgi:hypothetical protein